MQKLKLLFFTLVLMFSFVKIDAQLLDEYHEIKTINNDFYYGKLIFADTTTLSFLTYDNKKLHFKIEDIRYMKLTDKIRVISEDRSRIYTSQAIYGETAIPIKSKTWYYSSSYIFDNRFRYAFNNLLNIEVGNNPFIKNDESPIDPYIGLKANVSLFNNKLHLASKFSYFLKTDDPGYIEEGPFEMQYSRKSLWSSMITLGDEAAAITFSYNRTLNYNYEMFYGIQREVYQFGAFVKVSKRNSFNVESIRINKNTSLTLVGVRHDRYSTSFTYGAVYYSGEDGVDSGIPLPYFSLRVPIESK